MDGTSPKSNKVLCHGVLVGILEVFNVAGEGVLGSTGAALSSQMAMQGHRRACGRWVHSEEQRGYIRVHSGTFGYIRVHSGTLRPFQTFEKPHENQRFLDSTLFSQGTFAATTHPFYKTKKGELEFRCEPPFSHDVAI